VERDEDLTAPYAFQNSTWIAFEDKISVGIKVFVRAITFPSLCERSLMISLLDQRKYLIPFIFLIQPLREQPLFRSA